MTADAQIKSFFQRWERLEAEKKELGDLLKDLFAEAKSVGYDTKALRAAFRLKAKQDLDSPADAEFEAVVDTYLDALNGSSRATRAYARENIEKFDAETGEILDVQPVTIIDRTDEDGHRLTVTVDPEIAAVLSGRREQSTDIATASQGETESPSAEAEASGANAGGGYVKSSAERARNAANNVANAAESVTAGETATNSIAKPKYVLRPHCLNPGEACGGYSDKHCHACTVAMRKREQAEEVA